MGYPILKSSPITNWTTLFPYRGDTANDVVVRVHGQLLVGANVEEAARGVVGAGGEGVAVGEKLEI